MVGNSLRRCWARTCLRAEEIDCTDGGASAGIGVERPLELLEKGTGNKRRDLPSLTGYVAILKSTLFCAGGSEEMLFAYSSNNSWVFRLDSSGSKYVIMMRMPIAISISLDIRRSRHVCLEIEEATRQSRGLYDWFS